MAIAKEQIRQIITENNFTNVESKADVTQTFHFFFILYSPKLLLIVLYLPQKIMICFIIAYNQSIG